MINAFSFFSSEKEEHRVYAKGFFEGAGLIFLLLNEIVKGSVW